MEQICVKCGELFNSYDDGFAICEKCQNKVIERNSEKIVNSIHSICMCKNCNKIVSIRLLGNKWWTRDGFFQCGGNQKDLFSWCSDKCFATFEAKKL